MGSPARKASTFSATRSTSLCRVSARCHPMCGVMTSLPSSTSLNNGESCAGGSRSCTSIPAPAMTPSSSALQSAASSMIAPRAVFTSVSISHPSIGSLEREETITFMSKALAIFATHEPMAPRPPMRPSVLPASSKCGSAPNFSQPALSPRSSFCCCCVKEQLKLSTKVMTIVATASEE
eukprot:PRCOL_00004196-RA